METVLQLHNNIDMQQAHVKCFPNAQMTTLMRYSAVQCQTEFESSVRTCVVSYEACHVSSDGQQLEAGRNIAPCRAFYAI